MLELSRLPRHYLSSSDPAPAGLDPPCIAGFPQNCITLCPIGLKTARYRLRDDERGEQLAAKIDYIRQNPVVPGLCATVEDWPWWIERSALDDRMPAKPGNI
jgi:hypothetical protein